MRRAVAILTCLTAFLTGAAVFAVAPPAAGQSLPPDDRARGLIYSGLRRAGVASPCRGGFEIVTRSRASLERTRCTHGPDPVPVNVDPRPGQDPAAAQSSAAESPAAASGAARAAPGSCTGPATDAYRFQLAYARDATSPDRFASFESSFRAWADRVDDIVNTSAAKTGGIRHVRWVTGGDCRPTFLRLTISSAAVDDLAVMQQELDSMGLDRSDRKYLVWVDTPRQVYCGVGSFYHDTRADARPGINDNNGNTRAPATVARVDTRCWGQAASVEAHEVLHGLGGVQSSPQNPAQAPPHATSNNHCTDESDRLCYADGQSPGLVFRPDGTPTSISYVCPASHEVLFDCNDDDYFSAAPPPGNWLATHWNTAQSAWLERGPPPGTAPSVVSGSAWYSGGTNSASGPAGTQVRVYAVGLFQNVPYQLVTGRDGGTPGQACRADLVAVNPVIRYANASGFVAATVGTVDRLPGTYQVCFAQVDPVSGPRAVSGPVSFRVT